MTGTETGRVTNMRDEIICLGYPYKSQSLRHMKFRLDTLYRIHCKDELYHR